MPAGAFIKFVFKSIHYKWEGQPPDDFGPDFVQSYLAIMDAQSIRYSKEGFPNEIDGDQRSSMVDILTEMGAIITQVRSLRPDGTIRCTDLRLLVIY